MIPDNHRPINAGLRLATMILDHFFMCLIGMFFYLPMFITIFATSFKSTHEPGDFNFMGGPLLYLGVFGICLYFCKDIINGRSIAKRILKLQIVDNKTGEVASPLQCFVRDLFCIIWPVEFIVALANTDRRIGDRVAGTRLLYYDPAIQKVKPNIGRIMLPIIITIALTVLLAQIMPSPEFNKTNYSKTSYNHAESKALEQRITERMGEYLTPDIRIYDTVLNSNQKYVSAIINLKENYLEDDDQYRQLHKLTTFIIHGQLPKESFTGEIRYVFRGPGQFQSKSTSIGTPAKN